MVNCEQAAAEAILFPTYSMGSCPLLCLALHQRGQRINLSVAVCCLLRIHVVAAGCAMSRCLGGHSMPWECEPASQAASSTGLPSATAASSRQTAPTAHKGPLQGHSATPALEERHTETSRWAGVALLQATRTGHQQWGTPTEMQPGLLLTWPRGAGLVRMWHLHSRGRRWESSPNGIRW